MATPRQFAQNGKRNTFGAKSQVTAILEWVFPFALIVAVSTAAFMATSVADFSQAPSADGFWGTVLFSNRASSASAVGNLAEVLIGVLGLTLTVVAIVVQLAAQRYTPKLVDLFIADRVNILTFLYMVFATVFCIWVIYSAQADYVPTYGNLTLILITTILLTLLIPYFRYVFKFLTPSNIIETIEGAVAKSVSGAAGNPTTAQLEQTRFQVANGLEQVTDISLSAVTQMDRNVALMSIDTLSRILRNYIEEKSGLHQEWFRPNPSHFISISAEYIEDIAERKIWVEARGLMDLELIFGLALKTMPDAISAIATNTRQVAMRAIDQDDDAAAYLCIEYFNTFLRRAINDRNQRAVFSLFYQYRRLAQFLLPRRLALAEEITGFFSYYGHEAMRAGMPFLMNVAAMDICATLQHAYELEISQTDAILDGFLNMGDSAELHQIPFAHQGVRKAHVILAAYLLEQKKALPDVKKIQASLKHEKPKWLEEVKQSILSVTKRKFWEVTDRGGINFEFIEPNMKDSLKRFYKLYLSARKNSK